MKAQQVARLVVVGCLVILPGHAWAQVASATIAGVVKDTSGAVMPGVTVEASSPALIEKVRSVVTDDQGQYKIVNLRARHLHRHASRLPGFSTFKREGLELATSFTATVNAETEGRVARGDDHGVRAGAGRGHAERSAADHDRASARWMRSRPPNVSVNMRRSSRGRRTRARRSRMSAARRAKAASSRSTAGARPTWSSMSKA